MPKKLKLFKKNRFTYKKSFYSYIYKRFFPSTQRHFMCKFKSDTMTFFHLKYFKGSITFYNAMKFHILVYNHVLFLKKLLKNKDYLHFLNSSFYTCDILVLHKCQVCCKNCTLLLNQLMIPCNFF